MNQSVLVQLDIPADWKSLRLPSALNQRLQDLLDRQDDGAKLTEREREEATALAELTDMLSLLKVRAAVAAKAGNT